MAARRQAQDLLDVGAYVAGSNPLVDAAVAHSAEIDGFLRQGMDERAPSADSWQRLDALVAAMGDLP
jgi:flagellum-specific ATP synthase